jgi:hypothetical protein
VKNFVRCLSLCNQGCQTKQQNNEGKAAMATVHDRPSELRLESSKKQASTLTVAKAESLEVKA